MRIHYERLNENGDPIVLLHGWGHSMDSMRALGELLQSEGSVYLVDLPGFGESEMPGLDWSTSDFAKAMSTFLEREIGKPATLISHSFGGQISIRLAADYSSQLKKLVLINSAGLKREKTPRERLRLWLLAKLRAGVRSADRALRTSMYQKWFIPRFGSSDYKAAGELRAILVRSVNEDLSEVAERIDVPTLLMWGEKDTATPILIGERLSRLIKRSRLIRFPSRGHMLFESTGSHLCAFHIIPFLRSEPSA